MDLMTLNSLISKMMLPMAKSMTTSYIIAVVITGLTVVFLGLVILIFFVWCFGKIFTRKKIPPVKSDVESKPKSVPASVVKQNVQDSNEDEVIAVISAAIAAIGAAEGKTYKLKSVKAVKNKPTRSAWAMAGIQSDTNPF